MVGSHYYFGHPVPTDLSASSGVWREDVSGHYCSSGRGCHLQPADRHFAS